MSLLFVGNFLSAANLNRGYSEELTDRIEARGWRVYRTSARANRLGRLADMLATTWKLRRNYDVAHVDVFSGQAFVWAEAVCFELRRLGKPYVLTLRGGNLPEFAAQWGRRARKLLESAAVVTVPSAYLQEHMAPYRADLVLLRNAIDTSAYRFRARVKPRARLVWVRAFHEIYNPTLAIDVLASLARTHPDVTLTMLGPDKDGSLAAVLERAEQRGVRDRLTIAGQVPKAAIPAHLDDADVFINTTDIDNTPISVLEALAAGLPVVSTSVGGLPFMLQSGRDALLVPPRDEAAMANAVRTVLDQADVAGQLSAAGREIARVSDWSFVMSEWERTFTSLGGAS
jgi:glycosyltransferase involved in cell wall biosynthesis